MPLLEVAKVLQEKGIKEDDPIFKEVKDTFDLASAAQKIKDANADLTKQREGWETERKSLKGFQTEAETLKGQIAKLTDGNKDGQNTLEITRLKTELESVTTAFNSFKTEAETAKREAKEEKMRSSIISLASASKAINPDEVFMLMKTSGFVTVGQDGAISYARKNAKNEMEQASADESVKAFLSTRPYMIAASDRRGSGSGPSAGQQQDKFNPMDHLIHA